MRIRIYAEFGNSPFIIGGHPLWLFDLHIQEATSLATNISLLRYPPCPNAEEASNSKTEETWQAILDQNLFTIRNARAIPDYPRIFDGVTYVIQIKSRYAFREFSLSNPSEANFEDTKRFLAILSTISKQFHNPPQCLILKKSE